MKDDNLRLKYRFTLLPTISFIDNELTLSMALQITNFESLARWISVSIPVASEPKLGSDYGELVDMLLGLYAIDIRDMNTWPKEIIEPLDISS